MKKKSKVVISKLVKLDAESMRSIVGGTDDNGTRGGFGYLTSPSLTTNTPSTTQTGGTTSTN